MKPITKYETKDGKLFSTASEAICHEALIARVDEILAALGSKPAGADSIEFTNGKGYIQHDLDIVSKVRASFYAVALETLGYASDAVSPNEYIIGRYLNDSNIFLYDALSRLQCIDLLGREFGQAYYVTHPEKAVLEEIK